MLPCETLIWSRYEWNHRATPALGTRGLDEAFLEPGGVFQRVRLAVTSEVSSGYWIPFVWPKAVLLRTTRDCVHTGLSLGAQSSKLSKNKSRSIAPPRLATFVPESFAWKSQNLL